MHEVEQDNVSEEPEDMSLVEALLSDPSCELTPQIQAAIKAKWQRIVGPDTEIVAS